jgi:uncharacterized NAD(P)/FAD-binding protein YdhS
MQRVAIVGGGAAGAAVICELLRQAAGAGPAVERSLTWFVGHHLPGRGVAYATIDEQHLLNARASGMSLFADRPGDFLDYAAARGFAVDGAQFLPRTLYGDYVETTIARLLTTLPSGFSFTARSTEVTGLRPLLDRGFSLCTGEGDDIRADSVVLALGSLPPAELPGVSAEALASGAYATNAWNWPEPRRPPAHVLVIGTGLTAVDVLLSAAARWPQARLTAVSRRGCFPAIHADRPATASAEHVALIGQLALQPDIGRWLRYLRSLADAPDVDWRSLVDAVRGAGPALWQSLDPVQRGRFLRHLRARWETVRHRLPPATAASVQRLRDEGRLQVIAARVREVDGGDPWLRIRLQPRATSRSLDVAADFVIQATGFESGTASTPHALTRQLIRDGVVVPDPFELGFAAEPDGRLRRADGRTWDDLRAIGTLLRGTLWECTGMPEIRGLARSIAGDLTPEVVGQSPELAYR